MVLVVIVLAQLYLRYLEQAQGGLMAISIDEAVPTGPVPDRTRRPRAARRPWRLRAWRSRC